VCVVPGGGAVTDDLRHGLTLKRTSLNYGGFGPLSKKEAAAIQRQVQPRQPRRPGPTRRDVEERRRRIEAAAGISTSQRGKMKPIPTATAAMSWQRVLDRVTCATL
jgi:hypothetical protein